MNTATYGAGAWQLTATDYDTYGNITRTLNASATATVSAAAAGDSPLSSGQVNDLSTQSVYNDPITGAEGALLVPGGSRLVTQTQPARPMSRAAGSVERARPRTMTFYDQGAPNGGVNPTTGQAYSLPTTVTEQVVDSAGVVIDTRKVTTSSYAPVVAGDGDGWAFGTPTKVTVAADASGAGAISRVSRFDTEGRLTESRQPLSTGSDAGTTRTLYYTVGANSADANCGNRREWAGLTCRTLSAAAPSSGPTLPDERTSGYGMWLTPTLVVETSDSATRTTMTTVDGAGRVTSTKTTTSGLAGSTPRPGSFTRYDDATGLVAYSGNLNAAGTDADPSARVTITRDAWGRETSRATDQGVTVTTAYDAAGRVAKITDPKGNVSYGYDGTDAAGLGERRGLVTSLAVSRGGSAGTATFTAAYDADGTMTVQKLPGRITQRLLVDEVGQGIGLSYSGQVTPVTESTDPATGQVVYTAGVPVQDQPWLAWTRERDPDGRVVREFTGDGVATDGVPGVTSPGAVSAPGGGACGGVHPRLRL